ncbi:MAG: DNA mismatch repair protein MutH [Clostridia bacterium]|nr:DNA mismatch repair protein MutH [Deltaproteobacteria bacterium]
MRKRRDAPASELELMVRARALANRTVAEIARALNWPLPEDPKRAKGFVGQLIEAALGADPMAGELPDFPHLGVELKTVPIGPTGRTVESTFCCSIAMADVDREVWCSSRLRQRLARVLWMPVTGARFASLGERMVGKPVVWSPSAEEDASLRADWEDIIGSMARLGYVTAHLGSVMQARPKAANASVRQLGVDEMGATRLLPLGFYLRAPFTARIVAQP